VVLTATAGLCHSGPGSQPLRELTPGTDQACIRDGDSRMRDRDHIPFLTRGRRGAELES